LTGGKSAATGADADAGTSSPPHHPPSPWTDVKSKQPPRVAAAATAAASGDSSANRVTSLVRVGASKAWSDRDGATDPTRPRHVESTAVTPGGSTTRRAVVDGTRVERWGCRGGVGERVDGRNAWGRHGGGPLHVSSPGRPGRRLPSRNRRREKRGRCQEAVLAAMTVRETGAAWTGTAAKRRSRHARHLGRRQSSSGDRRVRRWTGGQPPRATASRGALLHWIADERRKGNERERKLAQPWRPVTVHVPPPPPPATGGK